MPTAVAAAEISQEALEAFVERSAGVLATADHALLKRLVATLLVLTALIRQAGTTIARLRRLFGGLSSEKTEKILPPKEGEKKPAGEAKPEKKPAKGHGRIPSSDYPGAEHIPVKHETLSPGSDCPACLNGHLYGLDPVEILRIFGQAPLFATIWDLEHLRCSGCLAVFTATAPPEAQGPKFSESAVSMMVVLRYGSGQPLNRLDHLQDWLQIPVPASTQWQVVSQSVGLFEPVFKELLRLAAQSPLLHNDDTGVRILELMGKRRAEKLARGELDDPERTGLFTTGIVAQTAEGRRIVLFFSGRKHAGENLADLLTRRAADLSPPIQMSDALNHNLPKGHAVVEGNCLAHGRRNFVDQIANFPEECRFLIEAFGEVFRVDARCKAEGLSAEERLRVHQAESGPVMERVEKKVHELLDQKKVEPNSDMGKALQYLLNHWRGLTLFLRRAGAPISNNLCERILKMAIRHRNNSLFYKTKHGADVGDLYMTLIATTVACKENPFEYLTVLQHFAKDVAARPGDWLPWTFRATLERLGVTASQVLNGAASAPASSVAPSTREVQSAPPRAEANPPAEAATMPRGAPEPRALAGVPASSVAPSAREAENMPVPAQRVSPSSPRRAERSPLAEASAAEAATMRRGTKRAQPGEPSSAPMKEVWEAALRAFAESGDASEGDSARGHLPSG